MINSDKTKITENTKKRELIIERMFNAPREQTWQAWTDPEQLAEWWGPHGWRTSIKAFEFKPGGVWRYCMTCIDQNQEEYYGQEIWIKAVFQTINAPASFSYQEYFTDVAGNIDHSMPTMTIELEFVAQGGKTKLIIHCIFAFEEDLKRVGAMGMQQGIAESFSRLDTLLAAQKAPQ